MKRLLFALLLIVSAVVNAQGKWVKLAPFPEPSEELLGVAAGGKMYVFCGLAPGWKPKALVYEYDPAGDKWTKKKPMPLASHHVSFTEHKGKIYAFGGFTLPQSGPASWVPVDNAWSTIRRTTVARARAAADQARLANRRDGGRQDLRDGRRQHAARRRRRCTRHARMLRWRQSRSMTRPATPGALARRCRRRATTRLPAW